MGVFKKIVQSIIIGPLFGFFALMLTYYLIESFFNDSSIPTLIAYIVAFVVFLIGVSLPWLDDNHDTDHNVIKQPVFVESFEDETRRKLTELDGRVTANTQGVAKNAQEIEHIRKLVTQNVADIKVLIRMRPARREINPPEYDLITSAIKSKKKVMVDATGDQQVIDNMLKQLIKEKI